MATIDDVLNALVENRRILKQVRKMILYSLLTQGEFSHKLTQELEDEVNARLDEVLVEGD